MKSLRRYSAVLIVCIAAFYALSVGYIYFTRPPDDVLGESIDYLQENAKHDGKYDLDKIEHFILSHRFRGKIITSETDEAPLGILIIRELVLGDDKFSLPMQYEIYIWAKENRDDLGFDIEKYFPHMQQQIDAGVYKNGKVDVSKIPKKSK